jgi:hypothetical protein
LSVHKFPGTDGIDEDKYKAFIAILIDNEGNIEVSTPEGFSKAELIGMLHMAGLVVMDNFNESE